MPEVNQYFFTHKEIVEALLKQAGIHEGRWMLLINFGFGAANVGDMESGSVFPTSLSSVQKIGIQRADENAPANLVVDAGEANPSTRPAKAPSGKSKD